MSAVTLAANLFRLTASHLCVPATEMSHHKI